MDELGTRGRFPAKQFLFDEGRILHSQFAMFIRAKQPVMIFSGAEPKMPNIDPSKPLTDNTEASTSLKLVADAFARHYLVLFRPEIDYYKQGQTNHLEYTWKALLEWIEEQERSACMLGKL
jgi:hypothetical protein